MAKGPGGRPSLYTQELADRICSKLAEGQSMRTVCKADDMPDMVTVFRWLRTKPEFCKQYEKSKEEAADALVEEMLDIVDDGTNDWMEKNANGNVTYAINGEHVQRSRLRLDARKWIASKLKPKKYGDKVETTLRGDTQNPLEIKSQTSLNEADRAILSRFLEQNGVKNDQK